MVYVSSKTGVSSMTDVTRHGKPSNAFKANLRSIAARDIDKLIEVSITAIANDEIDVFISFAYTMKFPDTFPRGICISRQNDGSNVHKVKAKRLLMWLHDNGHTAATVEMVGVQKRAFAESMRKLDNLI